MTDMISSGPLVVLPEAVEAIMAIGLQRAPSEACGILASDRLVIECTNKSLEPNDSYILDVEEVGQKLEEHDLLDCPELVVWHTHPGGGVGPSKGDMAERIPGIRYLVVTLPNGEATQY